jgi:hypothetical protein
MALARLSAPEDEGVVAMEAQSENSRQRRPFLPRLAVAVLAGAILYWMAADAPLPFIAAWWRAGEQHWSDPLHRRHRIADWLILSDRLIGHSREDVVTLLGEPPPTEYFKEWDMVYLLGAERGFISIDSEWLVLRLDDRRVVREARIVGD